jgi:hypothetical protein
LGAQIDADQYRRHLNWICGSVATEPWIMDESVLLAMPDWQPISSAPFDLDLQLSVIEKGEVHILIFPCRRVQAGWVDSKTVKPVFVRGKEGIWARWKSRLDTGCFGQRELMVRKPRAPSMSKEAMRQESERLVKEAMARNVTITQGKTQLDVKCNKCGAPNRVTAEVGHGRVEYACKKCGHTQKTL